MELFNMYLIPTLIKKIISKSAKIKILLPLLSLIPILSILSCKDKILQPELEKKEIELFGIVTGTFSSDPITNAQIEAEVINQESKANTTSDSSGHYSLKLYYFRNPINPKSIFINIKAYGSKIRFIRETGFQAANIEGKIQFNFDCIENYGDGLYFSLPIYNKLNIGDGGVTAPTYRWYPNFPDMYIIKSNQVSNKQVQKVLAGIRKISEFSRGRIPTLNTYIISEHINDIHGKTTHEWVTSDKIPGACAVTGNSADMTNILNSSFIYYQISNEYCSDASFHEMLHAMLVWFGLDLIKNGELDDHQLSLQIAFHYSRFPKHTFINEIDKDMKPYL